MEFHQSPLHVPICKTSSPPYKKKQYLLFWKSEKCNSVHLQYKLKMNRIRVCLEWHSKSILMNCNHHIMFSLSKLILKIHSTSILTFSEKQVLLASAFKLKMVGENAFSRCHSKVQTHHKPSKLVMMVKQVD